MFLNCLILILAELMAYSAAQGNGFSIDCGVRNEALETQFHIIKCLKFDQNKPLTFSFTQAGQLPVEIGTCKVNDVCSNDQPEEYEISRSGALSEVTVKRVTRGGDHVIGEWTCAQEHQQKICRVNSVIYKPEVTQQHCEIEFQREHSTVRASCHITKVYPVATCSWWLQRENSKEIPVEASYTAIEHSSYRQLGGESYYELTCTITGMPLPKEEGSYKARVVITPGYVEPAVVFTGSNVIDAPAEPELINCRTEDYIDYDLTHGDTKICTCKARYAGSPPGQLQWLSPSGSVLGATAESTLDLHMRHIPKYSSDQKYSCVVQHHIQSRTAVFTPLLAYGPGQVTIEYVSEQGPTRTWTASCVVTEVNPVPKIEWSCNTEGQGYHVIAQSPTVLNGVAYQSNLKFEVAIDSTITCHASNFHRFNSTKLRTIRIRKTLESDGSRCEPFPTFLAMAALYLLLLF